jgi:hypothetical protein
MTYSANGEMVGVFYWYKDNTNAAKSSSATLPPVCTCTPIHSMLIFHSQTTSGLMENPCSLQLLMQQPLPSGKLNLSQVAHLQRLKTFPTPDNFDPTMFVRMDKNNHMNQIQLLPTPCRLALVFMGKVLVWDVWNSKCLLDRENTMLHPMTPSPPMVVSLHAQHSTGLSLEGVSHWLYTSQNTSTSQVSSLPSPLLSPNGKSIAMFYRLHNPVMAHKQHYHLPFQCFTQDYQLVNDFVLDFSPDGTLAVVAMQG